ncbi:MAG: DUF3098 domain-containing protein [Bacteroidota bacterium]|nr:DUF3098 domain-containing protein [Bacteroidota bacterium]
MKNKSNLPFKRHNYILMIVGIFTIAIGFIIMTIDQEDYGFGFLGLTLGPIIVLIGFIIEFFAIFSKSKQ